jgi:hypothetical protein
MKKRVMFVVAQTVAVTCRHVAPNSEIESPTYRDGIQFIGTDAPVEHLLTAGITRARAAWGADVS